MKKPSDLVQLIENLESEIDDSSVETEHGSCAVIHTEYNADDKGIVLNERECKLVFHSEKTAERLFDALGSPAEATITLTDIVLEDAVIECLERNFRAVDEA